MSESISVLLTGNAHPTRRSSRDRSHPVGLCLGNAYGRGVYTMSASTTLIIVQLLRQLLSATRAEAIE
jgi:hypothetical protein